MESNLLGGASFGGASQPTLGERAFSKGRMKIPTTVDEKMEEVEIRTSFLDGFDRKKTASLLWMGCFFGFCGFTFAFVIGALEWFNPEMFQGMSFPSGRGYFPASIAEMVHNPHDPTGKVYFGFCFTSGIFLFASWYPWELKNVYTGDDATVCGVSWPMLRQFVSPVGYMISVTITSKPYAKANEEDMFTIWINGIGKVMFIVGFALCESHTLKVTQFKIQGRTSAIISTPEIIVRAATVWWVWFFFTCFAVLSVFVSLMPDYFPDFPSKHPNFGQYDKWAMGEDGVLRLEDTATGWFLTFKVWAYVFDSLCGLTIMWNHYLIWFYCDERNVNLRNKLRDVDKLAANYSDSHRWSSKSGMSV